MKTNPTSPRRNTSILLAVNMVFILAHAANAVGQEDNWFDRQSEWHGYQQFHFKIADRAAYLVAPKQAAAGNPWVWRARFPNYHAEMDIALLGKGFHIAYVDVAGMFGSPAAVNIGDKFYEYLTMKRGLSPKPALEGVSRGGLFVYNWAAKNPDKAACIYCDTPVCDIKSWPGGKGTGLGSEPTWQQCLRAYGLNEKQAKTFNKNPIDHAKIIAAAEIPLLHIVSENDRVVPPRENTYLLQSRLKQHDRVLEIISVKLGTEKSNGHHFTHPDPNRVVDFIVKHTQHANRMELLRKAKRVVFLGDSITYAGGYIEHFDAWLLTQKLAQPPIVINVGLPSETVSGLSEKGHAGGRFPRPDLAERLDRVLKVTKPDLVFACYGINCGIYQPYDEKRFEQYKNGINHLKKQVEAVGAKLVFITPPVFDDQRAKKSFSYNSVLDQYSAWLLKQRENGWWVIDLHGPMTGELANRRITDPKFTFQPDAVHPNAAGHWFIAQQMLRWFGDAEVAKFDSSQKLFSSRKLCVATLTAVRQRLQLRRDAYLTASRHKRPGIKTGMPIEQAEQQAEEISKKIQPDQSK